MNLQIRANIDWLRHSRIWLRRGFTALIVLGMLFGPLLPAQVQVAVAAPSSVTIVARDRATGLPIAPYEFRFIINEDIAHQADDGEPPSLTPPASYAPLVATGDETLATVSLDEGKYLVTVLAGHLPDPLGDGFVSPYKMWGAHFTVDGSGDPMTVYVDLIPNPLPLSTLRVRVFHDNFSVNGEDDIPLEDGLEGFHVVIADPIGEVTVDFFGNPICTAYDGVGSSTPLGDPVPMTGGFCATDSTGYVSIPNLPPGKYEVEAIPPDGEDWFQVTTIEGTHAIDAWIEEGSDGFSTEEGFTQALAWFGFVRPCSFGDLTDDCTSTLANTDGSAKIVGVVRQIALDNEKKPLTIGNPVPRPLIALNNLSGDDEQVFMGRGEADGSFEIPDVPPGLYQLVIWDFPQDYIIQFRTVQVNPGDTVVDVGDVGIPSWFGQINGYVYIDNGIAANGDPISGGAGNGQRDCLGSASGPDDVAKCERGLPGQDLDIRFKDGTIKYATFTDPNGYYTFPEYFEWEHFLVWEVGFGRFAQGKTTAYETNEFGEPLDYPDTPLHTTDPGPAGLLTAQLTWAGTYQWIDTGKLPWGVSPWGFSPVGGTETNGAISGIVYYATTRNEFDPRLAAAEDYEPGVPGVTINLYDAVLDDDGQPVACTTVEAGCPYGDGELKRATDTPSDFVETDSWIDNLPADCDLPDFFGTGLIFDPECLELPRTWNQVKDGVFDGGWAFEGLAPGKYIVEVVSPDGYRHIREEDQNTDQGDDYVPLVPPPLCAGPLHEVDDPRNPAHGTDTPLCDSKLVTVRPGFNAGAEFFLMTDNAVPPPGLLRGLLLDDLTLNVNPDSPLYSDKRGIPNTPVGILDFEGNHLITVYSDDNGYWEALLPSSYTALCPIPSGICPGMYQVIGNYPGSDPANPDPKWNPNYGALRLVFEIWPGKTTYADVAILPITGFIQTPEGTFETPPVCNIPDGTPDLQSITQPYGGSGDGGSFSIGGADFGGTPGTVTLDGTTIPTSSWSDTLIEVELVELSLVSPGPHQLLVTNDDGNTSPVGLTFHVLGGGYTPPQIHVDPAGDDTTGDGSVGDPYQTVQKALDVSADGDLILVHPGTYYESVIISETVKLQGYGPGASLIDGRFFNFGGISVDEFEDKLAAISYDGPAVVPMGQVITVLSEDGESGVLIDGFAIRGGSRVRGNRVAASQGGGVYAHAFADNMVVSNNLIQSNGGNMGGGIILGQAYVDNPNAGNTRNNENDGVRIHHNRVLNNGGISLAGGIALFNGATGYEIDHNVICGNYSAEYGGGISHFGASPDGHIHDNEILFNYAFDEGGGVMIAGEQPNNPNQLSPGSGDVLIERNRVQGNFSNDDGGGIRLLQPVDGPVTILNNMVVNNLATDHGGGISLDDALNVVIVNNTIAKNITTSTAEDAPIDDDPPPPPPTPLPGARVTEPQGAGLSSERHSLALRTARSLPTNSFSNPVLFNNIFWENEAFYLDGTLNVSGTMGHPSAGFIDLQVIGTTTPQFMTPNYSFLSVAYGSGTGNTVGVDPEFLEEVDTDFDVFAFVGDPSFVSVVVKSTPADPQGDYHLNPVMTGSQPPSPAIDEGVASFSGTFAPCDDFDGGGRPVGAAHDIGADEVAGAAGACSGPPSASMYFSTEANFAVPGLGAASANDDADIYAWFGGSTYSRVFNAAGAGSAGLAGNADIDALLVVDNNTFYMSFNNNGGVTVPTLGVVQDEDIVLYDGGIWSLYFYGSDVGLTTNNEDVDAFEILSDGSVIVSTVGNVSVPGLGGTHQDEDLLRCVGAFGPTTTCTWSLYFNGTASGVGLGTTDNEDVDGVAVAASGDIYLSTVGAFGVPSPTVTLSGADEDVFICASPSPAVGTITSCGSFSMFYDGSAHGLADADLDAIDLP